MINKIKKFWEDHGFETITFYMYNIYTIGIALYNIIAGKKGNLCTK